MHVSDVVFANILAMENEKIGKGEVINIGAGVQYSINHIARLVGGEAEYIPPRIEPRNTKADLSKARQLLNWQPQITLADGIAELKKYHNI